MEIYYLCFERNFKNLNPMANLNEFELLKNKLQPRLKSGFNTLL